MPTEHVRMEVVSPYVAADVLEWNEISSFGGSLKMLNSGKANITYWAGRREKAMLEREIKMLGEETVRRGIPDCQEGKKCHK